jgi:predicted nuclease with TOPRIM domain
MSTKKDDLYRTACRRILVLEAENTRLKADADRLKKLNYKLCDKLDEADRNADRLAEALSEMLMRISELLVNEPDVANALSALAAHESLGGRA